MPLESTHCVRVVTEELYQELLKDRDRLDFLESKGTGWVSRDSTRATGGDYI